MIEIYHLKKLENHFSSRPLQMRYNKMPILDNRETPKYQWKHIQYIIRANILSWNKKTTFSGFATNIDEESLLRNQYFALQKCDR